MNKKHILSGILMGMCLSVCGWASPLQVISVSPKGEMSYSGKTAIKVTFNQPVAALSEKSAFAQENCPLKITPQVEGTCRFSGTQTLQFEPKNTWQNATEYQVNIPAGFASQVSGEKLAKPYAFSFTTPRPEIQRVVPSDKEQWIDVRPLIFVTVSQPVDLEAARSAVQLTYLQEVAQPTWWERAKAYLTDTALPNGPQQISVPLTVRALTDKEYQQDYSYMERNRVFVVQPQRNLPVHTAFTLRISTALRAKQGTLGPSEDYTSVFYTYPNLQVAGANVQGCLPFDAHIDFTSPVRLSELLKHITVSPQAALAEVTEQEAQTLGYQRYVPQDPQEAREQKPVSHPVTLPAGTGYFVMPLSFLRVQPKQPITLTIDKDLTDIYGQKLGQAKTYTLTNNGYCPAVEFKGGTGVLESYLAPRHPIDVLNEKELEVLAARFSKQTFVPFAEKRINYCEQAELEKAALQYQGKYDFAVSPDKTKKTYLDLKKFNPTAHDSIIFSQVRVPSSYRKEGFCWVGATDNITDLGVTLKTSPQNTLVWVTSLQNGQPRGNLSVELRDGKNNTVWSGSTDENGIAWAPGWKELKVNKPDWGRPHLYAFVSSAGGDAVLASEWNDGLEPWRFNINYEYSPKEVAIQTVLFTDRGIYRPGETVHIKGVTRQLKQGDWHLPTAKKGVLKIYNSRSDEMAVKTLSYEPGTGAFDLDYTLPADATTGSWQLYFAPDQTNEDVVYSFQVEAVKQADFAVHVQSLQSQYTSGQKASFTASADYLFGAPVAQGKVKWSVRRANDWFEPKGFDGYEFAPYFLWRDEQMPEGLLSQSTAVLDEKGQVQFTVPLPKVTRRQMLYTEVGVQAPTGQQLFARTQTPLDPADFYLGAYRERWAAELGEPIKTQIVAVNLNGKRIGPVQVRADITKEEYLSVRKNGLAGRLEWVSQRRSKKYASQTFTVDMNGYDLSFSAKEPGTYQVTLSARDASGRQVKGGFEVTVYGKGEAYWKQNEDDILILKQEKDVYQPGQTARILVQSPYEKATALVSVEREGVLDSWTTSVSSGADYIEVPIKAAYMPNVFVSVTLVRGRTYPEAYDKEGLDLAKPQGKTGYAQLVVSQQEREIQTTVKPGKEQYLPGQEVTVKLNTTLQGKPTAADVTFMVVDEGVLALTNYQLPNLMKTFYALQPLSVSTADNRVFLIGQRNFGEKGENRGGGGSALGKLGGADLRSHFEFTPYFNARVRTNEKGKAEVKFKLPDNLTTFRLMAVAATVKEFGSGQATLKVAKPLMIVPKMPRFARRGDQLRCGAVVYNYEDEKGKLKVSAKASGALELQEAVREIQVNKGEAQEVSWPCKAKQIGSAQVAFQVQGASAQDGVQSTLLVGEVEKSQTLALYSATQDQQTQLLEKPSSVNEQVPNTVSVSLASTALLNMRGALAYLLTYPYDCLEQKMSKILPAILGTQLLEDFQLGSAQEQRAQAQKVLSEIPSYQDASGGLAYWKGEAPDPYVTAYALQTAYRAEKAGYQVPQKQLQKAANWLKKIFAGTSFENTLYTDSEQQTMRAYAVYVLALYGQKLDAQFSTLYARRQTLSPAAQAYLLQAAIALSKPSDMKNNLAQALLNHMQQGAQTIHFAQHTPQPLLHLSDVKVTALSLEALLQAGNYLPQPYQVVNWLTQQLNAHGYWKNTQENAAVSSALYAYYTAQEAEVPDFEAALALNGKNVFKTHFRGRSLKAQSASWPFTQVYAAASQSRFQVQKTGTGTLYYTLAQTYAPQAYTDAVNAGFAVSRTITDLQGNPVDKLKAGERYKVTLKTDTSNAYSFVVLEDFIPAGVELVNTTLATESQQASEDLQQENGFGYTHTEQYQDRIAAFANYLPSGEHTYSYLIQAIVPGEYAYPSVWASQMYDPAVFGHSATGRITIEP